jgi:hypothetical protein
MDEEDQQIWVQVEEQWVTLFVPGDIRPIFIGIPYVVWDLLIEHVEKQRKADQLMLTGDVPNSLRIPIFEEISLKDFPKEK